MQRDKFSTVDFIINYEGGELDDEQVVDGFQHLVNSGLAWQLQGSYGRMAAALIQAGKVTDPRELRRIG